MISVSLTRVHIHNMRDFPRASTPCISRPPILEPKNKFSLFLGENFLEKLILYLKNFFQARYSYTKKTTTSLDVKFIIARMQVVLKCGLATQV